MVTYAAFFLAIKVGKRKVPMEEMRLMPAGLGHHGVKILLNSGNAVFGAASARNLNTVVKMLGLCDAGASEGKRSGRST